MSTHVPFLPPVSECQLILSNNPPALPTSPSGTVLVESYISILSAVPTTVNPTAILGGLNASTAQNQIAASSGSNVSLTGGPAVALAVLLTTLVATLL